MFNPLVSADEFAWESDQRISMQSARFLEHSGDEAEAISLSDPKSLKRMEGAQSLLMYELIVQSPNATTVRVGQMRDIRMKGDLLTFRFIETGRVERDKVIELAHRLQMDRWETSRTHWAVKDGDVPQELLLAMISTPKRYDIVFSYAGEDREYVESVATLLAERGIVVFYDKFEQATLWGKDLAEHFDGVYRQHARYCVMFISRHYANKVWAKHERRAALARAMAERAEYVLPARFDDTEIPGLRPTIAYQDLTAMAPEELGELILQKLGRT